MNISGGEIRILDATDDGLNTGGADSGSHAMTIPAAISTSTPPVTVWIPTAHGQ